MYIIRFGGQNNKVIWKLSNYLRYFSKKNYFGHQVAPPLHSALYYFSLTISLSKTTLISIRKSQLLKWKQESVLFFFFGILHIFLAPCLYHRPCARVGDDSYISYVSLYPWGGSVPSDGNLNNAIPNFSTWFNIRK